MNKKEVHRALRHTFIFYKTNHAIKQLIFRSITLVHDKK